MNQYKPTNKIELILCILAFIIIPGISLHLGLQESILYENLTYIGNQPQYRTIFQIWGILISCDYLFSFYYLIKKTKISNQCFLYFACLLTIISISSFFIPYNPTTSPFLSNLHVVTSLFASTFTICLIIFFVFSFQLKQPLYFHKCFRILMLFITLMISLLFILGDISGLLELVMSIFLSIFLYYMIRIYDHTYV